MNTHIRTVAILHIVMGALGLIVGGIAFIAIVFGGLLSGDLAAMGILGIVAVFVACIFTILSLPAIIGGIGCLKYRRWGRITLIVIAFLDLLNFPIGTALSVYTLWVLLNGEVDGLFD